MTAAVTNQPDFMIIGAMKAGTTSLWRYIKDHPQIQMAPGKELHFFSSPDNWERGWSWYLERFPERTAATLAMGEASASYTRFPEIPGVPERIAAVLPDARFIYLVRHPIDRMGSHYVHRVRRGEEHRTIDEALQEDPRYLDASRYAMQIERYLRWFRPEQLLVMTSDELREHRTQALARVYGFLGVDPDRETPTQEREFNRSDELGQVRPTAARALAHPALRRLARRAPRWARQAGYRDIDPAASEITPSLRSALAVRLAPDVRDLRRFIAEPFDGWGIA